jgi:hypothetical protein
MVTLKTSTLTFLLAFASLAIAVAPYVRYRGCYSDSSSARALHEFVGRSSAMTIETCQSMCANTEGGATTFAGLEYGGECCKCAILFSIVIVRVLGFPIQVADQRPQSAGMLS